MSTTTFNFDSKTEDTINKLKNDFGVLTKAAVIRKAITLASIIQEHKESNNTVNIGTGDKKVTVLLD